MVSDIVVTTSVNPSAELQARARQIAEGLGAPYAPRRADNLAEVTIRAGAACLLIVGVHQIGLRDTASDLEYRFHPNMIPVRALHRMRGGRDLFLEAAELRQGDRLLDSTLGFGAEATLAAMEVGETGVVVGLESVPALAAVTREGLRTFPMPQPLIAAAMSRVQVVTADHREYLRGSDDGAFDVVYFDPFFTERLSGAENSISPLAHFGDLSPLDPEAVREARRVARRRVVIKHPRHESLPPDVAQGVTHTVTARHSRLTYSVLGR